MNVLNVIERHAELLHDRVKKTFRHFQKRFERQQIGCFRLYDWTIPEVRARVDYYEGHVVVAEYVREQTRELVGYLQALGEAARVAVAAAPGAVHLKQRTTRRDGSAEGRYARLSKSGLKLVVRERDARFWVNLDDFIDTGLFADHRETRALVREAARGRSLLNLYCYTGSFTVAAALGQATRSVSVDLSPTYLSWAEENMRLNHCATPEHRFLEADCERFLSEAAGRGQRWDLIVVDPPSFSTVGAFSSSAPEFDVQSAHPRLLAAALRCLEPQGTILFATNHQRFEPHFDGLDLAVDEITTRTVPEDYRHRGTYQASPVHRAFLLRRSREGG